MKTKNFLDFTEPQKTALAEIKKIRIDIDNLSTLSEKKLIWPFLIPNLLLLVAWFSLFDELHMIMWVIHIVVSYVIIYSNLLAKRLNKYKKNLPFLQEQLLTHTSLMLSMGNRFKKYEDVINNSYFSAIVNIKHYGTRLDIEDIEPLELKIGDLIIKQLNNKLTADFFKSELSAFEEYHELFEICLKHATEYANANNLIISKPID